MTALTTSVSQDDTPKPSAPTSKSPALLQMLRSAFESPGARPAFAGAILGLGLLAGIFATNLRHFLMSWSTDENYSHGFLVPLISLYFANLVAERGPVRVRGGVGLGATLLVVALLAKLATVVIAFGTLGDLAFILSLAGLCSLIAGSEVLRRFWFPIAFLLFMIPLPVALYALIASPLQLLVSQVASVVLNATNVPVLTEGNMMTLPGGVQMFVAEACSGMRQLTGFLALTAAVAYLTTRPAWYRLAVLISAVPIAMTANVARVVLTGYIMYFVNPEYASGTYHTIEGLLMLGFGLSLLRAECWVLDQVAELVGPQPVPNHRHGATPTGSATRIESRNGLSPDCSAGPVPPVSS
ncbi:MAG: exosortase/archaeosortase family protein [Isosphaeraceae bacterium]